MTILLLRHSVHWHRPRLEPRTAGELSDLQRGGAVCGREGESRGDVEGDGEREKERKKERERERECERERE